MAKNAFISFHTYNYGIGYAKNLLGAFYLQKVSIENLNSKMLSQDELNDAFFKENGSFIFDKVYYLYTNQNTINKITSQRDYKLDNHILQDHRLDKKDKEIWSEILKNSNKNFNVEKNELLDELEFLKTNHPGKYTKIMKQYWLNILHYNIEDQLHWFYNHGEIEEFYNQENFVNINIEDKYKLNDLHDFKKIAHSYQQFWKEYIEPENFDTIIINLSMINSESIVAWYVLGEAGLLSNNVKFIGYYDDKRNKKRFKDVQILQLPTKIISEISESIRVYDSSKSEKRRIEALKLKQFIGKGFAITIIGERGTGKSRLIKENSNMNGKNFVSISAASFDDDNKAESDLFGHEKGVFTGADKTKDGLFHAANNGILFIDEAHTLSLRLQEKMMSAIQTDNNGYFQFRKMGSSKPESCKFTIIFATNKSIQELKQRLLPDFFDRIVQYVIELPSLKESPEDRENDWQNVWNHMKFINSKIPTNKEFMKWLKSINLPGNYRDLERIAIWIDAHQNFTPEMKHKLSEKNEFEYAKKLYYEICEPLKSEANINQFSLDLTANGMSENYHKKLADWAKFTLGSFKKAADHFNLLGDSISEKTLYNWSVGKKSK